MSPIDDRAVLEARARRLARPIDRAAPSTSLTVIERGGDRVAFRTSEVAAVLRSPHVVPLPGLPPVVCGLLSHRGDPLPVFDLRALLGAATADVIAVAVVLESGSQPPLALAADRVDETSVAQDDLRPARLDGPFSAMAHATTAEGLVVLDAERLLADPRFVVSGGPGPT